MKDDWSITTGDGGVALYLPSDFAAELDAHTGDGSIRSELDLSGRERRPGPPHRCAGDSAPAARSLKISTGDGNIRLKAS